MAAARQGQAWLQRLLWVLSLCVALIFPAAVWADIYTWVDERGVQNFVDDPTYIPDRFRGQARLLTISEPPRQTDTTRGRIEEGPPSREKRPLPPAVSPSVLSSVSKDSGPSRTVEPPAVSSVEPPAPDNQGTVAVALAERLAVAYRPTPLQAASALLERGILPRAGWMLDEPIDPGWMADLARSLLAASATGQILQTPETALRTLEGVAAERGIALVAVEPPPPPQPQVIVTQPGAVFVERVFVGHFFHHPHFRKEVFKDRPHLKHHFSKDGSTVLTAGGHQHHPVGVHPRHAAIGKIAGPPHVGSHRVHAGQTHQWKASGCTSGMSHHPERRCP